MNKKVNTNTPVGTSKPDNVNTVRGDRSKSSKPVTPADDNQSQVSLIEDIQGIKESLSDIKAQLYTVTQSLKHVEELERSLRARDLEILELKASIRVMQDAQDNHEQHRVRNEIELIGLPEEPNESLHHVIALVANKIGMNIKDEDVDEVFRMGPRQGKKPSALQDRPIVVRMVRHTLKRDFLKSAKGRRNLTSEGIVTGTSKNIYINERLTRKNRLLFRDCRLRAKEEGYRFCWTNEGSVYIRKQEKAPAVAIKNHEDLEKYLGKSPTEENQSSGNPSTQTL